jgi:hypothetical protein
MGRKGGRKLDFSDLGMQSENSLEFGFSGERIWIHLSILIFKFIALYRAMFQAYWPIIYGRINIYVPLFLMLTHYELHTFKYLYICQVPYK